MDNIYYLELQQINWFEDVHSNLLDLVCSKDSSNIMLSKFPLDIVDIFTPSKLEKISSTHIQKSKNL